MAFPGAWFTHPKVHRICARVCTSARVWGGRCSSVFASPRAWRGLWRSFWRTRTARSRGGWTWHAWALWRGASWACGFASCWVLRLRVGCHLLPQYLHIPGRTEESQKRYKRWRNTGTHWNALEQPHPTRTYTRAHTQHMPHTHTQHKPHTNTHTHMHNTYNTYHKLAHLLDLSFAEKVRYSLCL
jgi:hypothetical protein